MVSKVLAMALTAAAMLSAAPMGAPTASAQYPDVRVSTPSKPTPQPMAKTQSAARDERERVEEVTAVPPRLYSRVAWDGKNRRPGDRAHKRLKHRRAAGRG